MLEGQTISWFALLTPALLAGAITTLVQVLITQRLSRALARYQSELGKDLEGHKKLISKEIEAYKVELQAEFQTKFYEFQTRYSLLHQKKSEAIETLFGLLAKVQNDLQILAAWERVPRRVTRGEFYAQSERDFRDLIDFFDQKRIYFDTTVGGRVRALVGAATQFLAGQESIEVMRRDAPELADQIQQTANGILDDYVHPLMCRLEEQFKTMLSAENRNQSRLEVEST